MSEEGSYWNHRTVRHVNSKNLSEEPYLTVHEIFYSEGKPYLWSPNERSPQSKDDCYRMARAFDEEPVVEVEDSSIESIAEGFGVDYKEWKWLVPHGAIPEGVLPDGDEEQSA